MAKGQATVISYRDILRPLFRHKLVFLASFLIIALSVYVSLLFQTPIYEARVLIHIKGVSQIAAPTYERLGPYRVHLTQMSIVKSNPVIKKAVKALKLDRRELDYESKYSHPLKRLIISYKAKVEKKKIEEMTPEERDKYLLWKAMSELKDNIVTRLEQNTDLFEIVVRDYDANRAIEIANVVSRSYTIYDLQQQLAELTLKYGDLHPTIEQLQDNINKMTSNLSGKEISDLDSIGTASVKIIEQATSNYISIGRSKKMIMVVGVIMGIFVGLALAFILDLLSQKFKTPEDLVQYLDVASLGTIPKKRIFSKMLVGEIDSNNIYNEFYDDITDQLYILMKVQKLKSLMFVSIIPNSMNAAVMTNIAIYMSKNMNCKILAIDANFNKPTLGKLLKIDEKKSGLVNLLEKNYPDFTDYIIPFNDNFHVIAIGHIADKSVNFQDENTVGALLKKIKKDYDAVFIDCHSVKKMSDITSFFTSVDGVVIIVNEGKDRFQAARNIVRTLKQNKANTVGAILNNRTFPIPRWLYNRL
jgi:Mrp family chromosome partitioning ATPase